jgi:hypothetical protein
MVSPCLPSISPSPALPHNQAPKNSALSLRFEPQIWCRRQRMWQVLGEQQPKGLMLLLSVRHLLSFWMHNTCTCPSCCCCCCYITCHFWIVRTLWRRTPLVVVAEFVVCTACNCLPWSICHWSLGSKVFIHQLSEIAFMARRKASTMASMGLVWLNELNG